MYRTDVHGRVTVLGYEDGRYEVLVGRDASATGSVAPPASWDAPWVFADAPGNDHQYASGEYAVFESWSTQTIDLGGWSLCDVARHCFRFPAGAILPDGGQVVVYTGFGTNDGVSFYMNSGQAVWNNDGDTATL